MNEGIKSEKNHTKITKPSPNTNFCLAVLIKTIKISCGEIERHRRFLQHYLECFAMTAFTPSITRSMCARSQEGCRNRLTV